MTSIRFGHKTLRFRWSHVVVYAVLILLTVTFLFPYVWLISSSFKSTQAIFNPQFHLLPVDTDGNIRFVLSNYAQAFDYLRLGTVFANTLIVCAVNTALNLFLNSLAGYAFARIPFKGRGAVFAVMLMSMMVPGTVMLIPNYIIINKLGMYDTLFALICPYVMSVYNIFLMRQQFFAVSRELEEAAELDGAGLFRIFAVIALPLVTPMLVVLGITTFMWNYNNFLWPLVATQSESVFTLARSLGSLVSAGSNNVNLYPVMLAGSVVVSLPMIVVFFLLQKYIIGGISVGAVKG